MERPKEIIKQNKKDTLSPDKTNLDQNISTNKSSLTGNDEVEQKIGRSTDSCVNIIDSKDPLKIESPISQTSHKNVKVKADMPLKPNTDWIFSSLEILTRTLIIL